MGRPMCANLVRAGHVVAAVDIAEDGPDRAASIGASLHSSPASALAGAAVVISMLASSEVTIEVAAAAMPFVAPGSCWVDMGSNTPATGSVLADLAAQYGIEFLESPVGGGPDAASAGTLQLFVGGPQALFERHLPVLRAMADPARITLLGGPGCGYTAKLLVNLLWFGQALATTEAFLLAQRTGIELGLLRNVLADSAAGGRFASHDLPALLRGDYLTTFGIKGCYDELAAVTALARDAGVPFALSDLVTDHYRQAVEQFGDADGELLVARLLEERAGTTLRQ
jgi:3-hydroxyisobutyrate dehydrogenase